MPLRVNQLGSENTEDLSGLGEVRRRRSIMRTSPWTFARRRNRTVSRLTPRWILPQDAELSDDGSGDESPSDSDIADPEIERTKLRFSEYNRYRIVPRTDNLIPNENGTFCSHCRHEVEFNLPDKINKAGLINCLDEFMMKRKLFVRRLNKRLPEISRNMLKATSFRGVKRKFNSNQRASVNINNTQDIMKSIYLRPGVCFKMDKAHPLFTPIFKIDSVNSKSNTISGRLSTENGIVTLNFEGTVVDLLEQDFRIQGKSPLIEGSIFSNLLRNSICFDSRLKKFIGRHSRDCCNSSGWKPFFMDKFGYLKSNDLSSASYTRSGSPSYFYDTLMTPKLSQSELSESEMSVWEDNLMCDDNTNEVIHTPAQTVSTSPKRKDNWETGYQVDNLPVQFISQPKFPSTSLFHYHNDNTTSNHWNSKILANWFLLPPFVEFLQTPIPPTPPKSHHFDLIGSMRSRGGMNPENVLICEKCLLGNDLDKEGTGKQQINDENRNENDDAGIMGQYIFIKGFIDIEDILWEDIYEEVDEVQERDQKDQKNYNLNSTKHVTFKLSKKKLKHKGMTEIKVKSDLVFKRRRRLSKAGQDYYLNSYNRQLPDWHLTSNVTRDPIMDTVNRVLPISNMDQIQTSDSDWDEESSSVERDDAINSTHMSFQIDEESLANQMNHNENFDNVTGVNDSFSEGDENEMINSEVDSDNDDLNIRMSINSPFASWTNRRRTSSVSSFPNRAVAELLYSHGRDDSLIPRRGSIFARNLYKNNMLYSVDGNDDDLISKKEKEVGINRNKDFRKSLNHQLNYSHDSKQDKLLNAKELKIEYDNHLKLYLFMAINRTTGELHYVPANLDVNNWSLEQNDGELFQDVETFVRLWGLVNNDRQCANDKLIPMKQFIQINPEYKRIEKLMFLHGLTNGSITNGLKSLRDIELGNSMYSNSEYAEPLFSEMNHSNIIDSDRVIGLKPKAGVVPYSFEFV